LVWLSHNLQTRKLRLEAFEAKVGQEGVILTETQVAALERTKADTKTHGEFESDWPVPRDAQETFMPG